MGEQIWTKNRDFSGGEAAKASVKKLVDVADYIIPGHGDMFRNVRKP
jgi:hypothetical protein